MTYLTVLNYQLQNDLQFNHLIYPKLKVSLWLNLHTQYACSVEKVLNLQGFIMPNSQGEILLKSLDTLQIGTTYQWGINLIPIGHIKILHLFNEKIPFGR